MKLLICKSLLADNPGSYMTEVITYFKTKKMPSKTAINICSDGSYVFDDIRSNIANIFGISNSDYEEFDASFMQR